MSGLKIAPGTFEGALGWVRAAVGDTSPEHLVLMESTLEAPPPNRLWQGPGSAERVPHLPAEETVPEGEHRTGSNHRERSLGPGAVQSGV